MSKKRGAQWVFSFLDRISAPARAAGRAVAGLTERVKALESAKRSAEGPINLRASGAVAGRGRTRPMRALGGHTTAMRSFAGGGAGGSGGAAEALAGGGTGVLQLDAFMAVTERIGSFAKAVSGAAASMSHFALSTASAKTNLLIGFETMLKSKDAARDVVAQINKFAAETPFEQADVAKSIRTLMGAQFSQTESFDIFKGLGDVSALDGFNPQALEGMVRVFTQMKAKGKLLSEELNQLAENSGGLLGKFQIQNAVMKLTGKTAEQVGKMLETGKVDAALGAKAILTAIEDNLSGGKLGGVMAKMAGEIPGLLSTIKDNLGAELIPSIDDNVGFSAVRDMMRSFAAASDRAKPFLKESFGRLFGAVFGGAAAFAGDKGRSAFEAMFATVGRGVQRVAQAIEFVGPIARGFAYGFLVGLQRVRDVLSPVSGALAKLLGLAPGGDLLVGFAVRFGEGLALLVSLGMAVGGVLLWAMGVVMSVTAAVVAAGVAVAGIFTDLMTSFDEAFAGLASIDLVQAGVNIMFGLAAGIDLGLSSVLDTVASAGQAVIARVEGVFGIASPSKVMERLGGYTAEGFAVGLGKGQGVVEASMDAMAPPALAASAPALTAASLTGGAPVSITVQVGDIYVTSPAGSTPRAVAEAVREQLTAQLAVELERLAASIGYAPSPA